jgi:hypothetical protein
MRRLPSERLRRLAPGSLLTGSLMFPSPSVRQSEGDISKYFFFFFLRTDGLTDSHVIVSVRRVRQSLETPRASSPRSTKVFVLRGARSREPWSEDQIRPMNTGSNSKCMESPRGFNRTHGPNAGRDSGRKPAACRPRRTA